MTESASDVNPYLQQEVLSASPIRLRWMLIRRAAELCEMVDHLWAADRAVEANQWLLRIREILGELLDGVRDRSNPLSHSVADLYVYLLKLALEVEQQRSPQRLQVLKDLLTIEAETWLMVLQQQAGERHAAETAEAAASALVHEALSIDRRDPPAVLVGNQFGGTLLGKGPSLCQGTLLGDGRSESGPAEAFSLEV